MMGWWPPFTWQRVFIEPWSMHAHLYGWILVMGCFVTITCALVGNFLVVRRMSLVGDAISHSVLPGLATAFLFFGSRQSFAMAIGAVAAAVLTTVAIEWIHRRSPVKQDAAIGVVFTGLFALGVILISLYADRVD